MRESSKALQMSKEISIAKWPTVKIIEDKEPSPRPD